jgi:hypothetical protein
LAWARLRLALQSRIAVLRDNPTVRKTGIVALSRY